MLVEYSPYENAIIDVTVNGEIYSFYTDKSTVGEDIEKFIKMPVAVACAYITGGVISLMHHFLTNINDYSKEDILKYCEKRINISVQNFI